MKPPPFEYLVPTSVMEAVELLEESNGEAKVIAGGQSLIPLLNFRLANPAYIIDLNKIPNLSSINVDENGLNVGALTRHSHLENSTEIKHFFPIFKDAIKHIAHLAIRNRGTLGGSLCHADPAAELPLLSVLFDATITVAIDSYGNLRKISAGDFFSAPLTTTLLSNEIVTSIFIPFIPPSMGWGFEEFAPRQGDFALASVGVLIEIVNSQVTAARIAVGGVHDTPIRITEAEESLIGTQLNDTRIVNAAKIVRQTIVPNPDLHASVGYRHHLIEVLTRRALLASAKRVPDA